MGQGHWGREQGGEIGMGGTFSLWQETVGHLGEATKELLAQASLNDNLGRGRLGRGAGGEVRQSWQPV